jgi:hypothetical protein
MAAISFAFVSCSDKDDTEGTGGTGGSNVVIPTGNGDVKFEPLSDAEVSALKAKGYNIVGTPVKVTQNGSEHVELNDMATVSIKIPDDFPKEQYGELVGYSSATRAQSISFPIMQPCRKVTYNSRPIISLQQPQKGISRNWNNCLLRGMPSTTTWTIREKKDPAN